MQKNFADLNPNTYTYIRAWQIFRSDWRNLEDSRNFFLGFHLCFSRCSVCFTFFVLIQPQIFLWNTNYKQDDLFLMSVCEKRKNQDLHSGVYKYIYIAGNQSEIRMEIVVVDVLYLRILLCHDAVFFCSRILFACLCVCGSCVARNENRYLFWVIFALFKTNVCLTAIQWWWWWWLCLVLSYFSAWVSFQIIISMITMSWKTLLRIIMQCIYIYIFHGIVDKTKRRKVASFCNSVQRDAVIVAVIMKLLIQFQMPLINYSGAVQTFSMAIVFVYINIMISTQWYDE